MKDRILTYGCRLNSYESAVIDHVTKDLNLENSIIINSCAVTNEVERQIKQRIRKIHREDPNKKIIVVGCAAQLSPLTYSALPGVVKVVGNTAKMHKASYESTEAAIILPPEETQDSFLSLPTISALRGRSRGFVQIQDGCNHDCTFCATTQARGASRSRSIREIVTQIQKFVDNGYKEVTLTGVDISDYGKEHDSSLLELLTVILDKAPDMPRIRLSSVDVAEISEGLKQLMANETRLMPHLHLSMQSGNHLILKRMKRRHTPQQVVDFCQSLKNKRPEIIFGADIIAGFPTETEAMFEDTITTIINSGITYLHIFPYSPKRGTSAARMPQVAPEVKKNRAVRLHELADKLKNEFLANQIGKQLRVVVEDEGSGRSETFARVRFENTLNLPTKEIAKIKISAIREGALWGQLIEREIYV